MERRSPFLQLTPNADWADRNLGGYLHETFGFELSLVLDAAGRTTYASLDGQRASADAAQLINHGLPNLLEQARTAPIEDPECASGMIELEAQVALAAVCAITPEADGSLAVASDSRSLLVVGKRLDPSYLSDLVAIVRVSDLRMMPAGPPAPGRASLPILAADGTQLAQLVWTPDRPGTATFLRVAPVLCLALLIVIVAAARVLWFARGVHRALQASEARFRDVADATSDWIWEADAEFRITFLSPRFAETMGTSADEVLGRKLTDFLQPISEHQDWPLQEAGAAQPFRNLLCVHVDAAGHARKLKLAGVPIVDGNGRHVGYRGTASDITSELEAQSRAQFLALHDPLTELPNRTLLNQRLQQAVEQIAATGERAAVLCIDLDQFKEVNDSLGHGAGDRLLRAVSERLQANVRRTDTVARVGGDEFVIVHLGLSWSEDAERLCRRLLRDLERPFEVGDQELLITVSIGVAFLPQDGIEPEAILRNADIALLRAKDIGRNTFSFYEQGMDAHIQQRKVLERELRASLKAQDFKLLYQPRMSLRRNCLAGVEALVRWQHPQRGTLLPGEFIPVAEDTGLILPMGEWVLTTACARATTWPDIAVAVNISPIQFKSRYFVQSVRRALERSGLAPHRLELEVTEGVLVENTEQSLATLRDLRALGVRLSMDDFGTGYASLSYLLRFEFDKIKIDRSFVWGLGDRMHADAIIRSVLDLGHSLGMEVCAEGVETPKQLEFLRQEGCDEVQGFLLSRPIPAEEFERTILPTGVLPVPAARVPAQREMAGGSERLGTVVAHDLGTYCRG